MQINVSDDDAEKENQSEVTYTEAKDVDDVEELESKLVPIVVSRDHACWWYCFVNFEIMSRSSRLLFMSASVNLFLLYSLINVWLCIVHSFPR